MIKDEGADQDEDSEAAALFKETWRLDGALEPASGIPENPCPLEPASGIPENPSSSGDAAVSDSETEEEQDPLALGPNPNRNLNRKRTRKPSPNPNPD